MTTKTDKPTAFDRRVMRAALGLAARHLGRTAPNPSVACILVKDGIVVGRGVTAPGGRPHAERIALAEAGERAKGATAYVTLEPCSHHGQTGPCADALIAAGIARCVIACGDPYPEVDGRGLDKLRAAGIAVSHGVCEREAKALNAGFFKAVTAQRPHVTLKVASTLDGRIATATGASKWITGPDARAFGHLLRARNDAILVGAGTVLADDPELGCRLPGLEAASPLKILLDKRGEVPETAKIFRDGDALRLAGEDLTATLAQLAGQGITRLLVEGGARVATAFLAAGLVDEIFWFRAPSLFGDDGRAAVGGLHVTMPDLAPRFERTDIRILGQDVLECFRVRD